MNDGAVLVFDPRLGRSTRPLWDRFRQIDAAAKDVDLIIIKMAYEGLPALDRDSVLHEMVGQTPVCVFDPVRGQNHLSREPVFLQPRWSPEAKLVPAIEEVRAAEIRAILRKNQAIYESANEHFISPSGQHVDKFVRLGRAMLDPADVAAIADWLIPIARNANCLLLDTGTILPLALELRQRLHDEGGAQLRIEILANYPNSEVTIEDAFSRLESHSRYETKPLVLVSVNSTGRLVRMIGAVRPEVPIIAICETSAVSSGKADTALCVESVCTFDLDRHSKCEKCHAGSVAVTINRTTYELEIVSPPNPLKIEPKTIKEVAAFWETVDRCGAVRLHVDRPYPTSGDRRTRHYPVFVDLRLLIEFEEFRTKALKNLLAHCPKADTVLVPEHESTDALVAFARAAYGSATEIIRLPGGRLTPESSAAIDLTGTILVLDDACIEGRTLVALRRSIYRVAKEAQQPANVKAFVLLYRPDSELTHQHVRNNYTTVGNSVGADLGWAERVYLPPLGATSCPWCSERKQLEFLRDRLPSSVELIDGRLRHLRGRLQSPALMTLKPILSEGRLVESFYGPLGELTAIAASASALYKVLWDKRTASFPHPPIDTAHLIGSYRDPALVGPILRHGRQFQLRLPAYDEDVAKAIERSVSDCECLGEIGWSAVEGKVPPKCAQEHLEQQTAPLASMLALAIETRSQLL